MVERYKSLSTDKVSQSEISFNDELTWRRLHSDLEESKQYALNWVSIVRRSLDDIELEITEIDDVQQECKRSCYMSDIDSTLQHIDFLLKLRQLFRSRKKIDTTIHDVTSIYSIEELTLLTKLMFVEPEIAKLDEVIPSGVALCIQKSVLVLGTSCISSTTFRQLVHFHYALSEHGKVALAALLQSHSSLIAMITEGMTVWREFHPMLRQLFDLPLANLVEPAVNENELVRQTAKKLIQLRSLEVPKMVTVMELYPLNTLMASKAKDVEWRLESNEDDEILF